MLAGFQYLPDVLSVEEECTLLAGMAGLPFAEVRMHGVVAKRRVVHYGWVYGYETWRLTPGPPVAEIFWPVRERVAAVTGLSPQSLVEVLVTEYSPGAGIGWHRDAPMFGPVVLGVSLGGRCRLRFRRGPGHEAAFEQALEPRSLYVLGGPARSTWQHSIPAVRDRRYSITFRALRGEAAERHRARDEREDVDAARVPSV